MTAVGRAALWVSTAEGVAWIDQGIRDLRASGLTPDTPSLLVLKAEALHLAERTSEALEVIREAEAMAERSEERFLSAELHWLRVCFSRLWVLRRAKLRLRFAKPSAPHGSRSRFRWRNAPKESMQNTAAKKRARQKDVDSDYLFGDCSQRAVSRFGCGKSSVVKQTLEMQSEDTSATRDSLKEACLARGVWVNS